MLGKWLIVNLGNGRFFAGFPAWKVYKKQENLNQIEIDAFECIFEGLNA